MIVCCGEALIDMIPVADSGQGASLRPHAGGAVFNTAIALGRLGADVAFLSGISTDMFGKQLLAELAQSHVDTSPVLQSDRPTTLAFVELRGGHATYTFYDENTAGRMLDPDALPVIPDAARALYLGGISLINAPAADFYLALALREAGKRVIVADPNIRANFITDVPAYRARLAKLIGCVDILKVSDEDLDWLVEGTAPLEEKAAAIRAQGPSVVVLTRGAEGAVALFGAGAQVSVGVPEVDVVDTVGAGDTFNAGFLAQLADDGLLTPAHRGAWTADALQRALARGAQVAAVTVSRAGANPPWAAELDAL